MSILEKFNEPRSRTPEQALNRGRKAQAILEEEVFREAVEDAEISLILSWLDTEPDETAEREAQWAAMHALDELLRTLRGYVGDGEVARQRLEER